MRIKIKAKNLYLIYYAGLEQIKKIMEEDGEETIIGVDIEEYCKGFKKQLEKDYLKDESIMITKREVNKERATDYFIKTGKIPPGLRMVINADNVELEKEE